MHFIQRNFPAQKLNSIVNIFIKNKPSYMHKFLSSKFIKNDDENAAQTLRKNPKLFLFSPFVFIFSLSHSNKSGACAKYISERFYLKESQKGYLLLKNFNIFKKIIILRFLLLALTIGATATNYPAHTMFDISKDESLSSYQIKRIFYNNNKFTVSEKIKKSEDGKKYIKIKRNFTMNILRQNKIDLLQLRDDNYSIKLRYNLSEKAWVFIGPIEDRFGVRDCLAIKISENLNF